MPRWGIWGQEYLGNIWENRYKYWVVETDNIQGQLLSLFAPELHKFIRVRTSEDSVAATILFCSNCHRAAEICECDSQSKGRYHCELGFYAEMVKEEATL